jgi:hypothetical protein
LSCRVPNLFVSNVTISEWGDTVAGTWFATGFTLFPKDVVYGVTLADISVSVASGCLLTDAAAIKIENIRGGNISGLTGAGGTSGVIFIQQCEDTQISNINITGTATIGLSITQDLAGAAGCLTSPYAGPAALTIENVNIRGSHTVAVSLRQRSGLYLKNVFIAQGAGYVTGLTGTTTTISDCVFSDIVAEKGSACLMANYAGATTNNSVFRNITTLDRSGDNARFTISGNNNRIQGVYSNAMKLSGDSNYVTDVDLSVASTARNSLEISGSKNLVSGVAEHTYPSYYHAALFGTGTYNIVDLVTESGIIKSFLETPQPTNVVNGIAREVTGSSTLSIFRAQKILLANTASTTIDTLIGDTRDGTVLLYSNNNNTALQHSSNLVLSGGVDYLIPANKGVLLFKSGVTYREIARD